MNGVIEQSIEPGEIAFQKCTVTVHKIVELVDLVPHGEEAI